MANLEAVKSNFITVTVNCTRLIAGMKGIYRDLKSIESQYNEFYAAGKPRALIDADFVGENDNITNDEFKSSLTVFAAILSVFENDANNSNLHKLEAVLRA